MIKKNNILRYFLAFWHEKLLHLHLRWFSSFAAINANLPIVGQ